MGAIIFRGNFMVRVNFPGTIFLRGKLSGGNYLGANHPGGNFSQEKLSKNPIKGSLIFFSLSLNNFLVITFYKYTYFIMQLTKSQARSEQSKYCTASSSASTPGQTSPATLSISQKS